MKLTDEEQLELITLLYKNDALVESILEDYARRMEKVDGIKRRKTIDTIFQKTFSKILEHQKKRYKKTLPEKLDEPQEVIKTYLIAACRALRIPCENDDFDNSKALEKIRSKCPELSQALEEYFYAYSVCYVAFTKQDINGGIL